MCLRIYYKMLKCHQNIKSKYIHFSSYSYDKNSVRLINKIHFVMDYFGFFDDLGNNTPKHKTRI